MFLKDPEVKGGCASGAIVCELCADAGVGTLVLVVDFWRCPTQQHGIGFGA